MSRPYGLLLLALLLPVSPATAGSEKTILAEGQYVMADGDTLATAEERVLLRAQRRAVEEAGVYLESTFEDSETYSRVLTSQRSALEIRTIAAAITRTDILESRRSFVQDRPTFYVRIRAHVDLDQLQQAIRRWQSERQLADHFRQLQKENAELKAQLHDLQARPAGTHMLMIEPSAKIRPGERAKQLVDRALEGVDLRQKLELTSQAAELDPNSPDPLIVRGQTYLQLVSLAYSQTARPSEYSPYVDNARMDFDRALLLDPQNTWALLGQGDVNTWLQRPEAASVAYEQALRLNPFFDVARQRLIHLWTMQARTLANAKQWSAALAVLNKLLSASPSESWIGSEKEAYLVRSDLYRHLNQPSAAVSDLNIVLQVDPAHTEALLARGKLHRAQLQGRLAKDDFEHACLLGSVEACQQLP